jgi:hypothetical protein
MAALDYLERYYDSGMSLPRYENREAIERAEEQRIARTLAVVVVAGSMPRRIGAASDEELRADKQTARRLSHALQQSLRGWSSRPIFEIVTLDDKVRRDGATVEWEPPVHRQVAPAGRRYLGDPEERKPLGPLRYCPFGE